MQMHGFQVPGSHLSLTYREWGQQGEPVLLLHGLADHGGVWASLADFLGDRFHCIAPDLRGHGDSDKPIHGYYCQDMLTDLEALMQQVGWTSAHVIAHSWAAKVACVWARESPSRVRSLVLVDPFFINQIPRWLQITFPILYRVLPFLKMMGPFTSYAQAERQARQLKQYRGWSELQQQVLQQAIAQNPDGTWCSKFVPQARDEIFQDVMEVAGLTHPLTVPTLFIQPEQGLNRLELQLRPYRTYLENLTIQRVPGNHWCFLVEPATFNQTVLNFLERESFLHVAPD